MGAEKFFRMGSFYRVCDRTGFVTRAERTQKEWQGLIVNRRVYEERQPQDFVRGIPDNQTVPYSRPRQPQTFVGSSTIAKIEVYGDFPSGVTFDVMNGQFTVYRGASVVSASNFPKSF